MKLKFLIVLVIICLGESCSKTSNSLPNQEVIESLSTYTLSYDSKIVPKNEFELIVQDTIGKKLLDTIVSLNKSITLNLKTSAKLFNITTIVYYSSIKKYLINTYLHANFDKWNMLSSIDLRNSLNSQTTNQPAQIHYYNSPVFYDHVWFTNSFGPGTFTETHRTSNKTIDIAYNRQSNDLAYLIIPSLKLYKLSPTLTNNDTIDLSNMDTATGVKFVVPPGLSFVSTDIFGYTKENDYAGFYRLYNNPSYRYISNYDLMYPKTGFREFELWGTWKDDNNGLYEHFSLADSVSSYIHFPGSFQLTNFQNSNFNIQFTEAPPTFYSSSWTSNSIYLWTIFQTPEKNEVNPQSLNISINSKYLSNIDLSSIKLNNVTQYNATGYTYQSFFNKYFDSLSRGNRNIRVLNKYTKFF